MRIFQAKHQKLILQCYPPGRGVDKKPNSSELSYLLYYATTRRVKLDKVGTFLERKNTSDVNHNRVGNVQVTLDIIHSLIEKCYDNLNVLASYVISILQRVFNTRDISLCKHALPVYCLFCEKLNGDLFTGDREFVNTFTLLTETVVGLGNTAQKPNSLEWKLFGLEGAKAVANCVSFSATCGKVIIDKSLPLIIDSIHAGFNEVTLLTKIKSTMNEDTELRKTTTLKKIQTATVENNDSVSTEEEEALKALKAYFDTTSITQLIESSKRSLSYILQNGVSQEWGNSLFELVTNWVPVQLRFIILATLLTQLTNAEGFSNQLAIGKLISGLLSSKVNMIGLSITDVIGQLLTLQQDLCLKSSPKLDEHQLKELSTVYQNCVISLSTHIYYYNQISDVISEILIRVSELYRPPNEKSISKNFSSSKVLKTIDIFLDNIIKLLLSLKSTKSTVERNHCTIEVWDLIFISVFQESSTLSIDDSLKVQESLLLLFSQFLAEELNGTDFAKPDLNQYITKQDNVLSHFFISIDQLFRLHSNDISQDFKTRNIFNLAMKNASVLIEKFGVNIISNALPFFFHWQAAFNEAGSSHQATKQEILKDTFAYTLLYHSASYMSAEDLKDFVLSKIVYRQLNHLWNKYLDVTIVTIKALDATDSPTITRKDIEDLVSNKGVISSWLDPAKSLILEAAPNSRHFNNQDSFNNSTSAVDTSMNSSLIEVPEITIPKNNGLGAVGDIHSVQSGMFSGGGSFLSGKRINSPKVSDLKEAISGSNLRPPTANATASILSKPTDVSSVLDELTVNELDDDDRVLAI